MKLFQHKSKMAQPSKFHRPCWKNILLVVPTSPCFSKKPVVFSSGPATLFPSNTPAASLTELIPVPISWCKRFSHLLSISRVKGLPSYQRAHFTFILMSVLETTQNGVKKGASSHASMHCDLEHLLFSCSLKVLSLPQWQHLCHQSHCGHMVLAHSIHGNCVRESANGSSPCSYTVRSHLVILLHWICWLKRRCFPDIF